MKKKSNKIVLSKILFILLVLSILIASCTPDTTDSLYTDKDPGDKPVITSITPAQGLAGVTKITISGENFSAKASDNQVFFVPLPATILSASENELVVLAPDLVKDSIQVKISVSGAEDYSEPELYKLDAAVAEVYPFLKHQRPYAITTDEFGNIYYSLTEDGAGKGFKKLTPDGDIIDFAPDDKFYFSLKYKTGGTLYGVRGVRAVFEITEGNAPSVFAVLDNSTSMFDLDFDEDGNIWTAGKGGKIFRVTSDKEVKSFEFADNVSAMRIFNGYLYLAATSDNGQNIVRMPIISADSLGEPEVYFAFSANVEVGIEIESFTFSTDGQMYIATSWIIDTDNAMNPILYVNSDGTFGGTWYQDLIGSTASTITWGPGVNAFMVRDLFTILDGEEVVVVYTQSILKLNMERLGAPEFGRD